MQEFQLLCYQLSRDNINTRCVTAWSGEAGDETEPDRVFVDDKDNRDRRSCCLGRQRRSGTSGHRDYRNSSASQIGRQRRQSIDLVLGPAVFNHYILTLGNVCRFEALTEYAHTLRHSVRRSGVEEPDHWHRLLLRPRRERPRGPTTKQRDELAALHSITSSARASTDDGISRPSALAVLRLIKSSYLVGACTGRSAGFSPLRMRST